MPEKFSCALADRSPNCACSCSKRLFTRRPTVQNVYDENGVRTSATSASFVFTPNIDTKVKKSVRSVFVSIRMPKPTICRTAWRSFVRRAMRSPIRWCWKYARCIV